MGFWCTTTARMDILVEKHKLNDDVNRRHYIFSTLAVITDCWNYNIFDVLCILRDMMKGRRKVHTAPQGVLSDGSLQCCFDLLRDPGGSDKRKGPRASGCSKVNPKRLTLAFSGARPRNLPVDSGFSMARPLMPTLGAYMLPK